MVTTLFYQETVDTSSLCIIFTSHRTSKQRINIRFLAVFTRKGRTMFHFGPFLMLPVENYLSGHQSGCTRGIVTSKHKGDTAHCFKITAGRKSAATKNNRGQRSFRQELSCQHLPGWKYDCVYVNYPKWKNLKLQ